MISRFFGRGLLNRGNGRHFSAKKLGKDLDKSILQVLCLNLTTQLTQDSSGNIEAFGNLTHKFGPDFL